MTKLKPDQETINSMFSAIKNSDQNAAITLDILVEEYDFSDARRAKDMGKSDEKVIATDQLDIYLHAVFHSKPQSVRILIDNVDHFNAKSFYDPDRDLLCDQQFNKSGSSLLLSGGNDVCWAILSNQKDALVNLQSIYTDNGLNMAVNSRDAVPISNLNLRNNDAKKHFPLDIAVMQYVAQSIQDKSKSNPSGAISPQMLESIKSSIVGKFASAGTQVTSVSFVPRGQHNFEPVSPMTKSNISILLNNGAKGSDGAYFPASENSIARPFDEEGEFEIMSMEDFCLANSEVFPDDLLSALTKPPQALKRELNNC